MNIIKKYAGILWIIAGPLAIYFLVQTALSEIAKKPTIDTKVQWIVFILIFTPIAIGLMVFGWYALKNEYQRLPESSSDVEE